MVAPARAEFDALRVMARELGNRLVVGDCDAALQALAS
jgi:hypothetical protein